MDMLCGSASLVDERWPLGCRGNGSFAVSSSAAGFLFFLEWVSFSVLSRTTLAMRSNSAQMPSMRLTLPFSSSDTSMDRKLTTRFISFVSARARGSWGFWRILANKVTSAETGKYRINLFCECRVSRFRPNPEQSTYQTQAKSPCGIYLMRCIEALAADTHNAAEEKTRGFRGLALSPWIA